MTIPSRVTVTGASGRVGRALRARLVALPSVIPTYLISPNAPALIEGVRVDVSDGPSLRSAVEATRPDVIVHLAAMSGGATEREPGRARKTNVGSTVAVSQAAAAFGANRVVFASSAAAYGDEYESPVTEHAALLPKTVYGRTKVEAEDVLVRCGVPSVSLRIFNVYGDEFTDSLVFRLKHSTPESSVELKGLDSFVRDYVHVSDVVEAILSALETPLQDTHLAINVGSGIPTSNRRLVDSLRPEHTLNYTVTDAAPSYSCANVDLAATLLGWSPRFYLERTRRS